MYDSNTHQQQTIALKLRDLLLANERSGERLDWKRWIPKDSDNRGPFLFDDRDA